MRYILDAKEAGLLDRISIEEFGIPSLVLMERASLSLAQRVAEAVGAKNKKILVIAGTGNNGGDGVAAGRILQEWGYDISICLLGKREKASPELETQLRIADHLLVPFVEEPDVAAYDLLIDAIFGIGLSREITGIYADFIEKMNASSRQILAVDVPSGISAATGAVLGTAVRADMTVTFGEHKRGLLCYPGAMYAGKIYVEDIGFPSAALEKVNPGCFTYEKEDLGMLFPKRTPFSHKGSYGKLLVIAGSDKISGAAFFAAKAAYRIGCGLVKVVTHKNNRDMLQTRLPEALLAVYDEDDYLLDEDLSWACAIVAGPGLGTGEQAKHLLAQVLEIKDKPVLLDADAINLLAKTETYVEYGKILLPNNIILTPHLLEMSRLVRQPVEKLKEDLFSWAKSTACGAVLVLKDARTYVSDGTRVYMNLSGNHALAKGGSGDVLSGIIGGLLARGTENFTAATLGVYLHGLTAEEYIRERSSSSMLASDILEMLPNVLW